MATLSNSRAELYATYRTSNHWKDLRHGCYRRAKGHCECCREKPMGHLEAHHTYYGDNGDWFNVTGNDLIALCPQCHDIAHMPQIAASTRSEPRGQAKRSALILAIRRLEMPQVKPSTPAKFQRLERIKASVRKSQWPSKRV
jgi:5-methylcytosine-specific restriction endonuclease McrA